MKFSDLKAKGWGFRPCLDRVLTAYNRAEDGTTTIFGVFTFVIMLMLTGFGVDIIRHETLRAELQSTLDRSVLAAANLDNEKDPEAVVRDYFNKAGLSEYLTSVTATSDDLGRRVSAQVDATLPTYFMKFASLDDLSLTSSGTAEQGMSQLEIALVLDVSGSMGYGGRMEKMKRAAAEFTDTVFGNSTSERTSISVIPYQAQVSAHPDLIESLKLQKAFHTDAPCLNFESDDFKTTALNLTSAGQGYDQTWKFDAYNRDTPSSLGALRRPACRYDSASRILPFSNDPYAIKSKVNSLSADGSTSIEIGMKWAAAMLDPSFTTGTSLLASKGDVSAQMSNRPLPYSGDTLKVIVVMTDGENTTEYRVNSRARNGMSDVYLTSDGRFAMPTTRRTCYGWWWWSRNCYTQDVWYIARSSYSGWHQNNLPSGATRLSWEEVWRYLPFDAHAYIRYQASGNSSDYYTWRDHPYQMVWGDEKDRRLADICSVSKQNGMLVFTIGFEVPANKLDVMKACASSPAHFYDVEGLEIADAFSAIAAKVTELRMVE